MVHAAPPLWVLGTTVVAPWDPDGDLAPRSIPFTFFDVKWLRPPPVQRLFFYRLDRSHSRDGAHAVLRALGDSLARALRLFYPLAGHVRLAGGNRYELFYQPGDGVDFTAAEHDGVDIDDHLAAGSGDAAPVRVARVAGLVPRLPRGRGRAVLAVQAPVLLGGRGVALGVPVHHSACDGASSTQFLHAWAAACAGREMPPPPVIDRTLIADPRGLYDIYCKASGIAGEIEFASDVPSYPDDQLLATFTLTQDLLRSIKDTVAGEAARRGSPTPPKCSSLVAAYSFIWSCYCRAKQYGADQAATTYFLFSVDHRARLKPAVPDRYFGNCLGPAIAGAPKRDLAAAGTEGLYAAFTAIAGAVEEAVGEGSRDRWDGCVERVKQAVAAGVLSVAGSPRFRVYDVDFGFGRPVKVDVLSVARTGAVSVAEARDSASGSGGLEVGISLPASGMERFRKCFADGSNVVELETVVAGKRCPSRTCVRLG